MSIMLRTRLWQVCDSQSGGDSSDRVVLGFPCCQRCAASQLYLVYGCPYPAGPLLFFTELRDQDRDAYCEPIATAGHAIELSRVVLWQITALCRFARQTQDAVPVQWSSYEHLHIYQHKLHLYPCNKGIPGSKGI
jgi:hypothetical protein